MLKKIIAFVRLKNKRQRIKYALKVCLQAPDLYPLDTFPEPKVDDCVNQYLFNTKSALFFSEQIGAKYFNFIQPCVGVSKKRPLTVFESNSMQYMSRMETKSKKNLQGMILEFYEKLLVRIKSEPNLPIQDTHDVFDNISDEVYFDQVHVSDIGNDLIAKRIAEHLTQKGAL